MALFTRSRLPNHIRVTYEFDFREVGNHFGERQVSELTDKLVSLMNQLNIIPAVGRWGDWDKSGSVLYVDDKRLRSFDEIQEKIIPLLEELLSHQEWIEWRVKLSEPDESGVDVYEFSAGLKEGKMNISSYVEYDQSKKQWCVRSENNPDWCGGCYDSESAAKERLKTVEMWKHMKGNKEMEADKKYIIRDQEMGVGDDVHWMSGGTWDGVITKIKENSSGTHDVTIDAIDGKSYTLQPAEHYGINLGRSKFYPKERNKEGTMNISERIKKIDQILAEKEIEAAPPKKEEVEEIKEPEKGKEEKPDKKEKEEKPEKVERPEKSEKPEKPAPKKPHKEKEEPEGEEKGKPKKEKEFVIKDEDDMEDVQEEATEAAIELLDQIVAFCIKETGGLPAWVKDEDIWNKAKEVVAPYEKKCDDVLAITVFIYEQMGGAITKK